MKFRIERQLEPNSHEGIVLDRRSHDSRRPRTGHEDSHFRDANCYRIAPLPWVIR